MAIPTLSDLAKRQIIRNIDKLDDVGELPYDFLRSILIKIENPEQLKRLEQNSPQIAGADAEIWRGFIKRDILHWEKRQFEPENPTEWWKVYEKLKQEAEVEYRQQEDALRAALQQKADEKAKNTTTISTKPIDLRRLRSRPQVRSLRSGPDRDSSVLSFATGSRTKTNTSRGVLDRVKRETMEAKIKRQAVLATPTHLLQNRASTIRQAPQGMVADHNKPSSLRETSQRTATTKILPPRKESVVMAVGVQKSVGEQKCDELVAREQKLNDITGAVSKNERPVTPGNTLGLDSLPPGMVFKMPKMKPSVSPERAIALKRKKAVTVLVPNKRARP